MLDWIKKPGPAPEHPMRDPASAAVLLAELRERDSVAALADLRGWLASLGDMPDLDERARSEVLGLIQEAGAAHAARLLREYLGSATEKPVVRESKWKALFACASDLATALCASAGRLLAAAKTDAAAASAAAAGAVRALRACRLLSKVCLVHYADVPPRLWRLAYATHAGAEAAGCAATAVVPHRSQRVSTTATAELLRLLMLHVVAPETLASEQIEVADRAAEQLGGEFTLRPPGTTDGTFRFDGDGDGPPQRASDAPQGAAARYFGPGTGLDSLARLHRQMAAGSGPEATLFGRDIASHAQIATVEHLLHHWGPNAPRAAPAHAPAKGELLVVHGFATVCRHLGGGNAAQAASRGLELASDDEAPLDPPEVWTVRDAGGSEVGAEMPQPGANWARSGMLVSFSVSGRNAWWLGVIRRTHADLAQSIHVDIGLLSKEPVALTMRPRADDASGAADWNAAAGTFAFVDVSVLLLQDASRAMGAPNVLLAPDAWKAGRVYEGMVDGSMRRLRLLSVLQRGEDFVRAACEWLPAADGG